MTVSECCCAAGNVLQSNIAQNSRAGSNICIHPAWLLQSYEGSHLTCLRLLSHAALDSKPPAQQLEELQNET